MNQTIDFLKRAQGFTRNPLSIIALFISFVYGIAAMVLSFNMKNLSGQEERLPLVWFVVLFPVMILGTFAFLVAKHHYKLYSPSDFNSDDGFNRALGRGQTEPISSTTIPASSSSSDFIGSLLNAGSVKGLFALYAVYLAYKTKKPFTLWELESQASLLEEEYTYGFLVATSSCGAFTFSGYDEPFEIVTMNPKLEKAIAKKCYDIAEIHSKGETKTKYLFRQLRAIEKLFGYTKPEKLTGVS